jgi:Leu/Phe-tRNA-protein transferase
MAEVLLDYLYANPMQSWYNLRESVMWACDARRVVFTNQRFRLAMWTLLRSKHIVRYPAYLVGARYHYHAVIRFD